MHLIYWFHFIETYQVLKVVVFYLGFKKMTSLECTYLFFVFIVCGLGWLRSWIQNVDHVDWL